MRKKSLSLEAHQDIGRDLKAMRDLLVKLSVRLGNTYGSSAKASRLACRATATVDSLRCELDNLVYRENPDRGEDAEPLSHVYYPGGVEDAERSGA